MHDMSLNWWGNPFCLPQYYLLAFVSTRPFEIAPAQAVPSCWHIELSHVRAFFPSPAKNAQYSRWLLKNAPPLSCIAAGWQGFQIFGCNDPRRTKEPKQTTKSIIGLKLPKIFMSQLARTPHTKPPFQISKCST